MNVLGHSTLNKYKKIIPRLKIHTAPKAPILLDLTEFYHLQQLAILKNLNTVTGLLHFPVTFI